MFPGPGALSWEWTGLATEVVWVLWRLRTTIPFQKLMDDSLVIKPTALPFVKQADVLQVQKLSTSHREWSFILGLQAPWAKLIPQQHHTLCDNNVKIFCICLGLPTILFHGAEIHELCIIFCCIQFLWPTKQMIYKTFHSCSTPYQSLPSQFHNLDIVWYTLHFIMQWRALSTVIA